MFSKHVKLLCFSVVLSFYLGNVNAQRSQIDTNLRGNSFGLENFLFQSYENAEINDAIRTVKPKRVRPVANSRVTISNQQTSNSGQTYGLENLGAQLYESSRLRPSTAKPTQGYSKRRPVEPTAESNRIKENFVVKPETMIEVRPEQETSTQEIVTERIRKKIMMRRRRKRPSNTAQPDGNSEITGNSILKPVRIPVYPQVSKVVIRTKSPDEGSLNRLQSVGVKTLATAQTEKAVTEETTEEEEPTTLMTEKSTVSSIRVTTVPEKPSTINLKAFLKQQTETLSLSELLQTQNLSLADLLRGNKDASAILKARQPTTSTTVATSTTIRRKQFNRVELEKTEHSPQKIEVLEVTTSRPNYNGFQPKIPRTKTNEQANTKPVEEKLEDITKQIKRPVHTPGPTGIDAQNRLSELRLKLRNFQKKPNAPVTESEITSKPTARDGTIEPVSVASKTTEHPVYKKNRVSFKSANNPELSLILPNKVKPELENLKRPERLTNWTSRLPSNKRFGQDKLKQNNGPLKPLRVPVLNEEDSSISEDKESSTTPKIEELPEEEMQKPEPKDELIELLKSGQNAERLLKVLYSRNMTIQELLDNREKPPLQTNISTLFSARPKQVFTSTQATLFDSLPNFEEEDADKSQAAYDEPEAEESAPSIARVQLMPTREPKQYEFPVTEKGVSQLNLQPDDLAADPSNAEDSALWKLSEKSIYYGSSYGYGDFPVIRQTEKPKNIKTSELTDSDIILLETIRRSQETNRKFKLDSDDFVREEEPQTENIEKSYIPPAVKSAIIASGVVMGIALFVFIAIFAACGWKQRQIRLKCSSTLEGTLKKTKKSKRTLSPVSFKDTHSYKKTTDFDDETSESGTSNTSSYLWSTLKNTFTSRASTLKSRMEKEEKMREDKVTLRRNESRRKESRLDDRSVTDEVYAGKKIDRDRNVINTSFNFKRTPSNNNVSHFNECTHGY